MSKIKIYADGADVTKMLEVYKKGVAQGFTTNPTLMKVGGVVDYNAFAEEVVAAIPDLSVSFEVFADDFETMKLEALKIASYGPNVFVKIPITNTLGESSLPLVKELSDQGVNLNVTAILTIEQVQATVDAVSENSKTIVSVFAGRVADTGVDPMPLMKQSAEICHSKNNVELLWASTREVLNIFQAEEAGCDIVTVPNALLDKLPMLGKDLLELSLDTVKMFNNDIKALGFTIL